MTTTALEENRNTSLEKNMLGKESKDTL